MTKKRHSHVHVSNEIKSFMECPDCINDIRSGKAPNESPRSYGRLEIGMTAPGWLKIRCVRHDKDLGELHVPALARMPQCDACSDRNTERAPAPARRGRRKH